MLALLREWVIYLPLKRCSCLHGALSRSAGLTVCDIFRIFEQKLSAIVFFLYSAGRIKSACLVWVNNWFWLALSVYCLMLRTCNSVKLLTASCRHLNIRNCIRCQNMYCTKPHAAYAAPLSLLIVGRFRLWLTTHGLSLVHDCLDIDLGTVTWLDNLVKNTVRLCGL